MVIANAIRTSLNSNVTIGIIGMRDNKSFSHLNFSFKIVVSIIFFITLSIKILPLLLSRGGLML